LGRTELLTTLYFLKFNYQIPAAAAAAIPVMFVAALCVQCLWKGGIARRKT
jgi:hypothetical protein